MIVYFTEFLEEKECAPATIEKYARDIKTFTKYLGNDKKITKQRLLAYKEWLIEKLLHFERKLYDSGIESVLDLYRDGTS